MKQNIKNTAVFVMAIIATCGITQAKIRSQRLTSARTTIEVGEPLAIELIRKYEEPTENITHPFAHGMRVVAEEAEDSGNSFAYTVRPKKSRRDTEKGEFTCNIEMWYDGWGKDPFQLIFTVPGKYNVYIKAYPDMVLEVNVIKASAKTLLATSLLADPNALSFIRGGSQGRNKTDQKAKLSEIAEKCNNTVIGQIAAGRLGIEYYKEFYEKNRSHERYRKKRKEEGFEDAILDEIDKYLKMASKLPDDMRMREEVIYRLAIVQFLKDDLDKASAYLDELIEKYPTGQYGRKAAKGKDELEEIKRRESLRSEDHAGENKVRPD